MKFKIPDISIRRNVYEYLSRARDQRKPDECYGRIFGTLEPKPIIESAYIWPERLTVANPVHVEIDQLDDTAKADYIAAKGDKYVLGCVHTHPHMSSSPSGEDCRNITDLLRKFIAAYNAPPFPIYEEVAEARWIRYPVLDKSDLSMVILRDKGSKHAVKIRTMPKLRSELSGLEKLLESQCIEVSIDYVSPKVYYLYSLIVGERDSTVMAVAIEKSCDIHEGLVEIEPTKVKLNII